MSTHGMIVKQYLYCSGDKKKKCYYTLQVHCITHCWWIRTHPMRLITDVNYAVAWNFYESNTKTIRAASRTISDRI